MSSLGVRDKGDSNLSPVLGAAVPVMLVGVFAGNELIEASECLTISLLLGVFEAIDLSLKLDFSWMTMLLLSDLLRLSD